MTGKTITGTPGLDSIIGTDGDDTIRPGDGPDFVHGKDGIDTLVLDHPIREYKLQHDDSENCWCRPRKDDGVIVHNSMDRREYTIEKGITQ